MKARVLTVADAAVPAFVTVHRDDGAWQPLAPDIAIHILDSDATASPADAANLRRNGVAGHRRGSAHRHG